MTEGDGTASSTSSSTPATTPASVSRNFRSAYYEKLGFCGNDEKNYLDILIEASPFDDEKLHELCDRPELDRKCIEAWKLMLGVECDRKNPFDDYANVRRIRSEHYQLLKHHLEVLLKHSSLMKSRCGDSTAADNCLKNNDTKQKQPQQPAEGDQNLEGADAHEGEQYHQYHHQYDQNNIQHNHQNHHHQSLENEDKLRARADHARLITMMYLLETGGLDSLDIEGQLKLQECRRLLSVATFFVSVAQDLQEAFFLLRNFTNHIRHKTTPSSPS